MKHFKLTREIKTGLLTVITLTAFIWSINYLKGKDIFKRQRTFYAVYDNVAGMMTANAVTYNGLEIGQVSRMRFHPNQPGRVVIEMYMSDNIAIPRNSIARIYSSDLLGTRRIQIIPGDSPELAKSGDTLIGQIQQSLQDEVNEMVEPIMQKTGNLITSFDTVLNILNDIFNRQTRDNLVGTVESLRNTMANLEKATVAVDTLVESQKVRLAKIISNAEAITSNLKENGNNLNRILSNTANITDSLAQANIAQTMNRLTSTVASFEAMTAKIERGEGTIGQLISNDKMYNELEASSNELKLLLEDMRLHPERYVHISVFGRNPKKNPYQTPVKE